MKERHVKILKLNVQKWGNTWDVQQHESRRCCYMCTLWLYASYSTGVAPLLISIFNSSSLPQLIHTCSEALQMSFCISLFFISIFQVKGAQVGIETETRERVFCIKEQKQSRNRAHVWITGWTDVIIKNTTAVKNTKNTLDACSSAASGLH